MRGRAAALALLLALVPAAPRAGGPALEGGVELRLRREGFRDNLWGQADAPGDAYLLARAMPFARLSAGPLRLTAQAIAATAWGLEPEPGPADRTGTDLLQGSATFEFETGGSGTAALSVGRELLAFGSERLVSRRYGANIPQPFEGGRLALSGEGWRADVLAARPVVAGPGRFDDRRAPGRFLAGAYATLGGPPRGLDAYVLLTGNDRARYAAGPGRERRQTYGLRLFGQRGGLSWNWEAMLQRGRFAGGGIRAWSLASETGYRFDGVPLAPRLVLRANIASGDGDPADGRLGTFNPLFPRAKYFGELTPVGPRNMVNLHPGLELDLGGGFGLSLAGVFYWRESRRDGLYDVPGQLLRPGDPAAGRHVGSQGEAVLAWERGGFSAAASLSVFAPGGYLRDTGPARTIVMTGLELGWAF